MKIFDHIEGFISGNVEVAKTLITLVKLEARMARLSIYPLLITLCMLSVILMAVWISAMVLLTYTLFIWIGNMYLALLSILALNIILLLILMISLSYNLRKMSFEKTRETFSKNKRKSNEPKKSIELRN